MKATIPGRECADREAEVKEETILMAAGEWAAVIRAADGEGIAEAGAGKEGTMPIASACRNCFAPRTR